MHEAAGRSRSKGVYLLIEYARQGSLYDFIRRTEEPNCFHQIVQWAKEVALGELCKDTNGVRRGVLFYLD